MSEKHDHDTSYQTLSGTAGQNKIAELVKDIHIAMMTTIAKDGTMSSRPMAVQNTPFDGTLWFLARSNSGKVGEIDDDNHVTLTFAEPKSSKVHSCQRDGERKPGPWQNQRALEPDVQSLVSRG